MILHTTIDQPARTEEDKITQAPLVVVLGGKKYEIKPLVIRDSREWRKKVIPMLAPIPTFLKSNLDSPEAFGNMLQQFLATMPDEVLDLFFSYAKDLDRKEIESTTTDAELAKAFEEVMKLAFPLAESLPKALGKLSR